MRFSAKKNENDSEYDNFLPKIRVHKSAKNHTVKRHKLYNFFCIQYTSESHNPEKKISEGSHYPYLTPQFFEEYLHVNRKAENLWYTMIAISLSGYLVTSVERYDINLLTTNVPHHIETSQLICNANQLTLISI